MTAHVLSVHPSEAGVGSELELAASIELMSEGTTLVLVYRVAGDVRGIDVPAVASPQRTDGLWEGTCFEAFLAPHGRDDYVELNFSPSTQWAAYAFTGYRAGMRVLPISAAPSIEVVQAPRELRLTVTVDLAALDDAPWPWHVSLAAVVRDTAGQSTYWALHHPRAKPDFHDAAGRVLRLEGRIR